MGMGSSYSAGTNPVSLLSKNWNIASRVPEFTPKTESHPNIFHCGRDAVWSIGLSFTILIAGSLSARGRWSVLPLACASLRHLRHIVLDTGKQIYRILGMNLADVIRDFHDEETCVCFLQTQRWPNGVECVKCKSKRISRITSKGKTGKPRFIFECLACRSQFSVKSGTLFHDSHTPLTSGSWRLP